MRIVQLSDIHLSKTNLEELKNYYREALIKDLQSFHIDVPIDVILITGDLLDRGGSSLGSEGYKIFEQEIISPIACALNIKKERFLFVPGNHDVNKEFIEEENEFFLASKMTKETANEKLKDFADKFVAANKRIQKFKEFERQFHENNTTYAYSNNESFAIEYDKDKPVGFALINDSWRCSPTLTKEQHFIGVNQLFNVEKNLEEHQTVLNIAVFHHPYELLNSNESDEIDNILKSRKFDIAIFGHSHDYKFESLISATGGIVLLNGRAAFNDVNEKESRYQPGYNILDIDIDNKTYLLHARKFIKTSGFRFDKDVESLPDGQTQGRLGDFNYYALNKNTRNTDQSLPSGYSADVDRIVKLLSANLYIQIHSFSPGN